MSDEILESEEYEEVKLRLTWQQLAVLRTVAQERGMSIDRVVRHLINHVLMDSDAASRAAASDPSPDAPADSTTDSPADASTLDADSRPTDDADAPTGRSFFEVAGDTEATADASSSSRDKAGSDENEHPDARQSGEGRPDEEHDEDVPRSKSTWQFNEVMSRLQRLNERAANSTGSGSDASESGDKNPAGESADEDADAEPGDADRSTGDADTTGTSMFDLPNSG